MAYLFGKKDYSLFNARTEFIQFATRIIEKNKAIPNLMLSVKSL